MQPQVDVFQAVDGGVATGHSVRVGASDPCIKEIRKGGINYDDS